MSSSDDQAAPALDDESILIEDEPQGLANASGERVWTILVVDDDPDVHQATDLALRGMEVEGRPLRLLHAHSGAEARQRVKEVEDLAVLLLDVVMESEDAGLKLVEHVRRELNRKALRIVLRTGQPGYAPEQETIRDYDINDYKTKSELTRIRLYTTLTAAVRAYRQMRAHEDMRRGLETVVRASTELTKLHGMQLFAQGVVGQLCALLDVQPEGLICAQEVHPGDFVSARVIAAAGHFQHLIQRPLDDLDVAEVQQSLKRCLAERRSRFDSTLTLYFATASGCGLAAYVQVQRELDELDQHLLEVFCASMAVGFENVQLYARLVDQAFVDPLLKLPNLNRLIEVLDQTQVGATAQTLALLDVDQFSSINDTLGHAYGDAVLRAIAARLLKGLPGCTVARIGNDVFGVLGPGEQVNAETLTGLFAESFEVQQHPIRLAVCIGLVALGDGDRRGNELMSDAHVALKQAKLHQRGSAVTYSQRMGQDVRERTNLLAGLRDAFGAHKLFLVYQPKVNLSDGRPSGFEALMRWRKDDGQYVPPDRFIPLAEQAGMMEALGTYVLRSACQQLARFRSGGYPQLSMAINVSQAQLREPGFMAGLRQALQDSGAPPSLVELEITESMAADDLVLVRHLLGEIAALGVKVAIDDFGTGFSSLSVLRHLQAQRLKIDRSFVNEMAHDDSIARMVIGLGHSLGMSITAEGVETMEQAQALREMGCDEAQGYHFGRPMDEGSLLAWLAAR